MSKEEKLNEKYPFQFYTFSNISMLEQNGFNFDDYSFNLQHEHELYIGNINGLICRHDMGYPLRMLKYLKQDPDTMVKRKLTFLLPENYKENIGNLKGLRENVIKVFDLPCFNDQINILTYKVDNSNIMEKIEELKNMPKFDVAIMNPPYAKNLHLKIIEQVILFTNKTVSISPCTWAAKHNINQPKGQYRNKFNGKIESFTFIPHRKMNDIFGLGNAIEDGAIIVFSDNGNFDILNYGFSNNIEKLLFTKIKTVGNKHLLSLRQTGVGTKKIDTSNINSVSLYQWHSGNSCYEAVVKQKPKPLEDGIIFNTLNEKINFENSLKTIFMNWYHKAFIVPGDNKIVAYMFIMKDYTNKWDNKRFCEFFGITGYISDDTAEPNSEWEYIINSIK